MCNQVFRPLGIIMTVLGLYFLFSPIIAILKFIPLVGYFLGAFVSFAAFLFALVVGVAVSTLTIGLAWLRYRPLIGIPLLLVTGGIIYLSMTMGAGSAAVAAKLI